MTKKEREEWSEMIRKNRRYKTGGYRPFSMKRLRYLLAKLRHEYPRIGWKKLLWFAFQVDLKFFAHTGRSMTGAIWIKTPYGAAPKQLMYRF